MRILFLDHPQHTQGTWVLYEGLKRVLGWDSLVVFPYKQVNAGSDHNLMETAWYRDVYRDVDEGYDLPRGVPPLQPGERLTANDERTIFLWSVPTPAHAHDPQREHGEDEVVELLDRDEFSLVVLGNSHRVPTIALGRLMDRISRPLPPVVYLDAGERDEHNAHWTHLFRPSLVFKQILTPEVAGQYRGDFVDLHVPLRLWPMPLANALVHHEMLSSWKWVRDLLAMPEAPRQYDVFSHFGATWHERAELQARVLSTAARIGASLAGPGKAGFMEGMYDEYVAAERDAAGDPDRVEQLKKNVNAPYFVVLSRTRVGVSMRGSGRDTDRYWEIPAFGCAMLCDGTMGCVHPYPNRDGETAVFYRTYEEVERKLEWLLRDEGARVAIATAGRGHVMRHHCVEARALFFLDVVKGQIGVDLAGGREGRVAAWRTRLGWDSAADWRGPVAGFSGGHP